MLKKLLLIFFIYILALFNIANAEEILKINSINFDNSDNIVVLNTSNNVPYINVKSMKLSNPNRISFDIDNAILTTPNKSWSFTNSVIKQIKLSQFNTNPNVVRMVITYNKQFNVNKLKLYRMKNSLIFVYNKNTFNQKNMLNAYNDENLKENYHEYTTYSEDEKKESADNTSYVRSPELVAIQKAFDANGKLIKKDIIKQSTKTTRDLKLKSQFYVNRIDIKRGNALIRGIGQISLENNFTVSDPNRLVYDLPNTYVAPEIRNKEYILGENETIKIGQNEPTKARIVITTNDTEKFRPIFSYDRQSIFLAHDDRILGISLFDKTSAIYTYSAKKIDENTDKLYFVFTEPIIHSIKKFNNKVEIDLHNSSGFDHEAYKKNLTSEVFAKLKTEQLPQSGIRLIIPIEKNMVVDYKESFDNKQLCLILKKQEEKDFGIITPKTSTTKKSNTKSVIIDAGHGGTDVGATREGIYEKDLTLDIAERLESILKKKGLNVYMVRKSDKYVSLEERVEFSEQKNADLFISIHVNSSVTPEGNGIETHYYTPQSYDFAQVVHKEFAAAINSKDRGLFKSKFYVINHTTCPSILVETGFISNPEERQELLTKQRKQKTAEALAKGILKYLGKN
jgi:N-acetylmuramoyl-L-alanine amidase